MLRKITTITLTLLVTVFLLTFSVGCAGKNDCCTTHPYGEFTGVRADHTLTNQCFIDLVWIENDTDWSDANRQSNWEDMSVGLMSAPESNGAAAPGDHSVTNVQVEGVLEGDIVQVDSNHIFYLSHTGLTIVNVNNRMNIVYRDDFENFLPDEMFILGDLIVVIGGYVSSISYSASATSGPSWWGHRINTAIKLYDISDRNNVTPLVQHSVSGRFVTARLIDDQLVVLTNHQVNRWNKDTILPLINGEPIEIGYVHIHETGNLNSHIILTSLNLSTQAFKVASHFGLALGWSGSAQYFSREFVYFFVGSSETINDRGDTSRYSYLRKISLSSLLLTAETTLEGHVNDRFWVSEHNGNLRVFAEAFTSGRGNLGRHTNLYVFDSDLAVIVKESPIAIGQRIHAVRFRGEIAAIDTYILIHIRIDSVSRVDLSDLANITIAEGEPDHGVNEYLHFITDDIMIGLGFDAQTTDRFTTLQGIKVTLYENIDGEFNIINSHTLGEINGANSEALSNPRAILADPARNMFSIPITIPGERVTNGVNIRAQGLAVFEYVIRDDGNHEFIYRGILSNIGQNRFFSWENFRYHSLSFVQRGVRIGDRIYTISDRFITSYDINTLNQVQRLTLDINVCSILGHDFESWTTVQRTTCTQDGIFRSRCRRCGTRVEERVPAWGHHNFTPWAVTTLPNGNNPGQETRRCQGDCGTVESRNLTRHSHVNGLLLRFDEELDGYAVRAYMGTDLHVTIPSYHNNIPIVSIDDTAFVTSNINVTTAIGSVEIGANVRHIGDFAFGRFRSFNQPRLPLNSVTFAPNSQLVSIGMSAFSNTSLTSIVLPQSLETIGQSAFVDVQLTNIVIPASVLEIGASAFSNSETFRSPLANVTFATNSQLRVIGHSAFANSSITSITIPASVTTIGGSAFAPNWNANSLLTSLNFEANSQLETIGASAFIRSNIASVAIPSTVTNIGHNAFADISTLTNVTFGNDSVLTTIGASAFTNTRIAQINLPQMLETIGSNAFANTRLTAIVLPESLQVIGSGAFSNTDLTGIVIPSNVTTIGSQAFFNARLETVDISASVTSIGHGAFASNPTLSTLTLALDNEHYRLSDNAIIRNATNTLVAGTNQARISPDVAIIGNSALHNMGLTNELVIPVSVVEIQGNAISANPNLTSIYFEANGNLEIIGWQALADNSGVTSMNLEAATSLINIQTDAFRGMIGIGSIIIPENVWLVAPWAFRGWTANQTVIVAGATGTLDATIRLGENWMAGSQFAVIYALAP